MRQVIQKNNTINELRAELGEREAKLQAWEMTTPPAKQAQVAKLEAELRRAEEKAINQEEKLVQLQAPRPPPFPVCTSAQTLITG